MGTTCRLVRVALFGYDHGHVYDLANHEMVVLRERKLAWRFTFRIGTPARMLNAWMADWDYRFRTRYRDLWRFPDTLNVRLDGLYARGVQ